VPRATADCCRGNGRTGETLPDVGENRYLIPDISALSDHERDEFLRYVYW
jgi:hypothetical protein